MTRAKLRGDRWRDAEAVQEGRHERTNHATKTDGVSGKRVDATCAWTCETETLRACAGRLHAVANRRSQDQEMNEAREGRLRGSVWEIWMRGCESVTVNECVSCVSARARATDDV